MGQSSGGADGKLRIEVDVDLQTEHKTPTRIPEWQMLSFAPCGGRVGRGTAAAATAEAAPVAVAVDKLGSSIDVLDVVAAGGVHLHSVGEGGCTLRCSSGSGSRVVSARSPDVSLVSVGRKTAFPTPLTPLERSELAGGVHFVIHDNVSD